MRALNSLNVDGTVDLNALAQKYGTDKTNKDHSYKGVTYLDIYHRYMSSKRSEVKTFIEIGVKDGASLRMWKDYFPNATIYGIDIDPRCKQFAEDRIEIIIGDQNSGPFLRSLIDKFSGGIDILLDDGSHITRHQIGTFGALYPLINPSGLFIIEDLANSYEEWGNNELDLRRMWPGMAYNDRGDELKNYRKEFDNFANNVIKGLDLNNKHGGEVNPNLISVHFYPMIAIFENF